MMSGRSDEAAGEWSTQADPVTSKARYWFVTQSAASICLKYLDARQSAGGACRGYFAAVACPQVRACEFWRRGRALMTESVNAWQCIGCGRIEAPQTCVGICEYRKVQFVNVFDHEQALATAVAARREADILGAVVRQLAHTSPRQGECERSYEALQKRARRALLEIAAAPTCK
jgi:hypothetical protein